LTVIARAVDLAGNSSKVERRVIVDNTPPQLTLSSVGFLKDGSTWWTASAAPTLLGSIVEANPSTVQATIGATQLPGTIVGGTWAVELPEGMIDLAGANVTIRVTDRAGNHTELTQRIRYDKTPPLLTLQTSTVTDEGAEAPLFSTEEDPIHSHNGTPVDLSVTGSCPTVTKYSYLLGATSPTYVTETPARNPIAYKLVVADDGVGIVDGSTQYRVLRREASGSTVLLDWTSAGPGTQIATTAWLFDVSVVAELVSGLKTTEGAYDVEFRATDRLSRVATTPRCFTLHLRASPLHFGSGGVAVGHAFALNALRLEPGSTFDRIAPRLLNNDASGASLIDQPVINGTTETVYLTVGVTRPSSVAVTRKFVIRNFTSNVTVSFSCGPPSNPNPACDGVEDFPSPVTGYTSATVTTTEQTLTFPAKLYETDTAGTPIAEIPCLAPCSPSDTVFKFAVPPRGASGAPARRFKVMTMIGPVSALWPSDGTWPASPPFSDDSINGVRYTGREQFQSTGCSLRNSSQTACIRETTRIQYRALTLVGLDFANDTSSSYATAATAQLAPKQAIPPFSRTSTISWSTSEPDGTLP
jgi:hypothetical protein